jgi:hypothetical protein
MDYVSVADARKMSGIKLALTAGSPAPWSMSARTIFEMKSIPFTPVLQVGAAPNDELFDWTGHRNGPVLTGALDPILLTHRDATFRDHSDPITSSADPITSDLVSHDDAWLILRERI